MKALIINSALFMAGLLLMLLWMFGPGLAHAYTCDQVKAWHRQYGTAALERFARENKLSAAQKRAGRSCLNRKRHRIARR